MSFPRIQPAGYPVGGKVTSAQFNQLDVDHANALDKTIAGDQLAGVVTMASTGQIQASFAASIQSTAPGGIELAGGSNDWVGFSAPRSRIVWAPPVISGLASGWSPLIGGAGICGVVGPGTAIVSSFVFPSLHNGAKLTTFGVLLVVGQSHSGIPAVMPNFSLAAKSIAGTLPDTSLANFTVPTPASGAAWYNGGAPQQILFTFVTPPTIDTAGHVYYMQIGDESGTNALSGNVYQAFGLGYGSIQDMAFP